MSELGDWARRNAHKSKLSAEVVNVVLAADQLIEFALAPESHIDLAPPHHGCVVQKRFVTRLDQAIYQLKQVMDEEIEQELLRKWRSNDGR